MAFLIGVAELEAVSALSDTGCGFFVMSPFNYCVAYVSCGRDHGQGESVGSIKIGDVIRLALVARPLNRHLPYINWIKAILLQIVD